MEHQGTTQPNACVDGHDFQLDLRGVSVTLCISDAAIALWVEQGRCEHSDFRRIRRIASELVGPHLRNANARAGERWIARVGPGSVGLAIAE